MTKSTEHDQVWLVKSAGLVLGPFSLSELSQALKEKKVALLDEVRTPTSRWGFVRETPPLRDLVKVIRDNETRTEGRTARLSITDDLENTESVSATLKVIETTPLPFGDELTLPISVPNSVSEKSSVPQALGMRPSPQGVPQSHAQADSFGAPMSPVKEIFRKPKFLVSAVAAVVVILGLSMMWGGRKGAGESSSNELLKLAKQTKAIGFYDKALMMFQRALGSRSPDAVVQFEMLPLFLQTPDGAPKAEQMAQALAANSSLSADMQAKVANWWGLALMRENQGTAAEEQFKNASEKYPHFEAIGINRMINQYLSGQIGTAVQMAGALQTQGVSNPLLSLTWGMASLYLPNDKITVPDLTKRIDELTHWTQTRRDYLTEALLISAALQDRAGLYVQVQNTLNKILDQTPGLTQAYVRDLDYENSVVSWPQIHTICENLSTRYSSGAAGLGLDAFCKIESGNLADAGSSLQTSLQKYPAEPHLIALQALVLKNQGNGHDAKQVLENSQNTPTRLGNIVRAQACLDEKDLPCAEGSLQAVLSRDSGDPEAQTGLVQLDLLRNKRDLAQQTAEKALNQTGTFKPLLEVREEMGDL